MGTLAWDAQLDFRTKNLDLVSPDNNSEKLNLFPELIWEQNDNVGQFRLQVSKDDDFGNLELDEILFKNSYQLYNLKSDQVYFWRVQPINVCGLGDFSNYNMFKTDKTSCIDFNSSEIPSSLSIFVAGWKQSFDLSIVNQSFCQ